MLNSKYFNCAWLILLLVSNVAISKNSDVTLEPIIQFLIEDEDDKYYVFENASSRSTAYVENSKITSYGNYTVVSILNNVNGVYKIHLVKLYNNSIVEQTTLNDVIPTNHGGGSIAFNANGHICLVYAGHVNKLKYKCSSDPYSVVDWEEPILIDADFEEEVFQTYPSIQFDTENNLHIAYREQLKDPQKRTLN